MYVSLNQLSLRTSSGIHDGFHKIMLYFWSSETDSCCLGPRRKMSRRPLRFE